METTRGQQGVGGGRFNGSCDSVVQAASDDGLGA